ncbi:hypothetical protein Tco_1345624 [Tanacetum coccineum]
MLVLMHVEMWKAIERVETKVNQHVQNLGNNLYWEVLENSHTRDVNVQFLLQLQPEWQRFVTLVKQSQELKTVSYHKLYDILKQHQNEVNEIRAERLARTANPLALKLLPSSAPTYDARTCYLLEDKEMSKEKEIDKLMALISLSFKKIYKPTNNNLRTSSNTSRANQDNSPRINRGTGYDNQRAVNVAGARENVGMDHIILYRHNSRGYCQIKVDNSGPIFDDEPMHKVQNNNDNYNVFAMENEHPEQPESSNDIYLAEQGDTNITIDSSDICYDRAQDDQDETDNLDQERDLLASLIQKLKCEIDDSKNRNKFFWNSSNKELVDKLKGEIEDFKTKNKSLESSNNHFKEANNELSKTNQLMFKDLKKFQAELDKYNDVNYASKVEIDCAKAKGDLMSFVHIKKHLHNPQAQEAQIKLYKTREDKELDKVIALENKVKVLNDIVYKTSQSVQTMNMLNRNCKTSFAKPEFLKKAQRANPRLYDIGCYNDNLALMLAPDSDETIRLDKERRSKLIDLIRSEYFYADHMNAILGVYTDLDKVTNLQCDYLETMEKCEHLEKELSKSRKMSKSFEALQKHAINLELDLQQCKEKIKNDKSFKEIKSNVFLKEREQYFKIQDLKAQLQDKGIAISELKKLIDKMKGKSVETKFEESSVIRQPNAFKRVIPNTSVSRPHLKSNHLEDRVMSNNSQGKKQEVEDHRRKFKFSKNKTSVTACNDSLNAKTLNVNFVCVTCGKCVLNENHDLCVLHYINGVNSRTRQPMAVPISTREPKQNVNQFVANPQYRRIRCCQDSKSVLSSIGGRVSEPAHWMSSCILDILYYYDMICFDRSMISECTLKVVRLTYSYFVLVILNPEFEIFQISKTEAQLAAKGYQTAAKK